VDVACAAAASAELGAGLGDGAAEERGWATRGAAGGRLGRLEGVAGAAAAGVDVGAGRGVRLGDLVVGGHFVVVEGEKRGAGGGEEEVAVIFVR